MVSRKAESHAMYLLAKIIYNFSTSRRQDEGRSRLFTLSEKPTVVENCEDRELLEVASRVHEMNEESLVTTTRMLSMIRACIEPSNQDVVASLPPKPSPVSASAFVVLYSEAIIVLSIKDPPTPRSSTITFKEEYKQMAKDAWEPNMYNSVASFVYSSKFTAPLLELLSAQPGERILDLGCGSGELTLELQRIVGDGGVVVGVDASESMIGRARQNGLAASFICDAQQLELPPSPSIKQGISSALPESFDYKFDAVFSNAALHWCKRDPHAVVRGAANALRKGGRFVGEMGGFMNTVGVRSAIYSVLRRRGFDPQSLDPWYFPSVEDYKAVLESAGFRVEHISLSPRLTPLSSDIIDWQRTFCRNTFYTTLSDAEAEEVMHEVQDICAVDGRDASGTWSIMYCRLRFAASLDK
ncbi:hypothetical protein ACEPAF_9670 [Sanghuangporus sanghuang]